MKTLKKLGKVLRKAEQKSVYGGRFGALEYAIWCEENQSQCRCLSNGGEWDSHNYCCFSAFTLPGIYDTPCP